MIVELEINTPHDLYFALDKIGEALKEVDPDDHYSDTLIEKFKRIAEREGYGSKNKAKKKKL